MTKKSPKTFHRAWCITINNYTPDDLEWDIDDTPFSYILLGKEEGKSGTPHLQGFVYAPQKVSFDAVKKVFPTAHIEVKSSKSSLADAILYCMKDNDFYQWGVRPRQGRRSDLDIIRVEMEKGKTLEQIAIDDYSQFSFHRRSMDEYMTMRRLRNTKVYILKDDNVFAWADAKKYMRGKFVIIGECYEAMKLFPYYFSGQYDNIITIPCANSNQLLLLKDPNIIDLSKINL